MARVEGEQNKDFEFIAACRARGLELVDIEKFAAGFETPGSGLSEARADIVAHNKKVLESLPPLKFRL